MTTTAYLRVSTDQQDAASQRHQIATWAAANGATVDRELSDTASGSTPWQSRAIAPLITAGQPGDVVVVSEISRIARSVVGVLTALQTAAERGVNVIACKNGLRIDGSLPAKIVVTVFALVAEIERDLIRERTRAALQARKARGQPIGRQLGATGTSKCQPHAELIARLLAAKTPKRAIARLIDVAPQTLYDYLDALPKPEAK
jgi:DNA invertase Pin-like site-specific DNA recombinase